jgi:hypothetical protein
MAVGDLAEVVVKWNGFPGQVLNVFGFEAISAGATLVNLGSAFSTALIKNTSGGLLNTVLSSFSVSELQINDVVPGTAAPALTSFTAVFGSSATGEALPHQCSAVLSWRTALAGRSFRGRSYLPGRSEAEQAGGVWTPSQITASNAMAAQFLAVFGPSGTDLNWQFVIISRVANGVPRVPPIGTPVISGAVRSVVFTQRRRVSGVGS